MGSVPLSASPGVLIHDNRMVPVRVSLTAVFVHTRHTSLWSIPLYFPTDWQKTVTENRLFGGNVV
jgi:hypothetical protein